MGYGGQAYGCGQCLPCRLKKRREWTHRIMLEASTQKDNCFLTLTYAPSSDPDKDVWSLEPKHHRQFMDALRKRIKPLTVRFYCVGEYGEKHGRPHFHYALFGYPSCRRPARQTKASARYRCCAPCDVLEEVWGKGFIYNKPLEMGSARYIARYVVKKMTRFDDPRLNNRHPEFARMSLKPGIGRGVLKIVADQITRYNLMTLQGDVPVTLQHGGIHWPLGRYLRKQLRRLLGLNEKSPSVLTAEAAYAAYQENEAMRAVQSAARNDQENPGLTYHLLMASLGARQAEERRHKIFNRAKDTL